MLGLRGRAPQRRRVLATVHMDATRGRRRAVVISREFDALVRVLVRVDVVVVVEVLESRVLNCHLLDFSGKAPFD